MVVTIIKAIFDYIFKTMKNYDNWKLSTPSDNGTLMVSTCCGTEYTEDVMFCKACDSYNIDTLSSGDESITKCNECGSLEQEDYEEYVCSDCDMPCEIQDEYEYEERRREEHDEWNNDNY